MHYSLFFAKFIGLYLTLVAIAMIINVKGFQRYIRAIMNDQSQIILLGILSLVFGLIVVILHNVWTGWPIIITLLGWLAVIKGLVRLYVPDWHARILKPFTQTNYYYIATAITLILGLILIYFGFFTG